MDPFAPQGTLPSFLDWLDRPGQIVRNALTGNPGGAARQGLDFLLDAIDAPLPGDWIPALSDRGRDYVSGSELIGLDDADATAARLGADVGLGLLTDPLTYLTFGAAGAAKAGLVGAGQHAIKFAGKTIATTDKAMDPLSVVGRTADAALSGAAKKIDDALTSPTVAGAAPRRVSKAYEGTKDRIRSTMGWWKLTPETRATIDRAHAAGATSSKVWLSRTKSAMQGLDQDERVLIGDALDGLDWGSLDPRKGAGKPVPLAGSWDARVQALATKYGKDPAKLLDATKRVYQLSQEQWDEGIRGGIFRAQQGAGRAGSPEYLQRVWDLPEKDIVGGGVPGLPSAVKGRKLETPQDLADFFAAGGVGYERDAAKRLAKRAEQQGRMLERATLGRATAGDNFALANADDVEESLATIKTALDSGAITADDARRMTGVINGMPERGGITSVLAKTNRVVKPAMVYGVVLPKVGSIVRNKVGMLWQAATNEGATPGRVATQARGLFGDVARAFDEAYGGFLGIARSDKIGKDIDVIERTIGMSKGADDAVATLRSIKRDDLADAVEQGVLDGFVSSEEVIKQIAADPKWQKWSNLYDAPGVMFQAVEQRGRLASFLDERAKHGAVKAGQNVRDMFLDYTVTGPDNRTLRDIIPFAQFMSQSIPQQAKRLSQTPAVGVALNPLFNDPSGEQDPAYPWMQGKTRIPVGSDAQGNALYLSGLGLPVEALDTIPNLSADFRTAGRDVSQGVVASSHPLIKSGVAYTTGEDPYFGTPFGAYTKLPLVGEAGDAGRYVNMAGATGLLEPIPGVTIARQAGQLFNPDRPMLANAADVLTGAKLTAVDPDRATQQVITDYLESRPDVAQYRSFYQTGEDEGLDELMRALREAKARVKAKREAAEISGQ